MAALANSERCFRRMVFLPKNVASVSSIGARASARKPTDEKADCPPCRGAASEARRHKRAHGLARALTIYQERGTVIGTEAVSRAVADGNTLLITSNFFAINPYLRKANYRASVMPTPSPRW
jgi:Tripartite tricarboxylate transporter family receptor